MASTSSRRLRASVGSTDLGAAYSYTCSQRPRPRLLGMSSEPSHRSMLTA